eukprot:Anaeramoba_flamelloidesc15664_g1_i1.p2 GENE.c15664_g1_i1~~c15664_g1_i1.p2  ORF type:complete len:128 (+),score=11.53 c15664_g1_i1:460-843(+)
MNNITVGLLFAIGTITVAYSDIPEQFEDIFVKTVAEAQLVTTAGDMKSMSTMLDATWLMDRRLPSETEFESWMRRAFKENNVKSLLEDHWGNPYVYTLDDTKKRYILYSAGPDGSINTEDDLFITGP